MDKEHRPTERTTVFRQPRPAERQQSDLTPSLVARLRNGDTTTGNLLDQLYRRPLVRFCYGYFRDRQAAEDAVQEVFCRVLRASEVPDDFRAWLYRIVRNHCISLLRAGGHSATRRSCRRPLVWPGPRRAI